jgi:tetratricopeptide (TPR) repeat protein
LDAAYAERMRAAAKRYPKDDNIAVLTAEALMDLQPWDYWGPDGKMPKGNAAEIVGLLETVLKRNADHPGAIHYYIHAVEASSEPRRAERYAERLGKLTPGAGHLVHMPSHIFYRIGRYLDSLEVNKAAVAADETYIQRANAAGIYPQAYYPHAIHMLMVSAQMAGDGNAAIAAAEKLAAVVSNEAASKILWVQPIKAAPYFAHAQFSEPQRVLALPDPGDELPYVKALWHYARSVAAALDGDIGQAKQDLTHLNHIAQATDFTSLTSNGIPATDVLTIARHVIEARIAQAQGDLRTAAASFQEAVVAEDRLAYMEPPFWYYPVRQSLGAVLVQLGELDRAEEVFRASLARAPNNGWSLYGLQEVYRKRGDDKSARAIERRLAQAWAGTRQQLSLSRL